MWIARGAGLKQLMQRKIQSVQMEYCHGYNTAEVWDRVAVVGFHLGYICPSPQGRLWVLSNRPCGVLCKFIAIIIYLHLVDSIKLCDVLHRFIAWRGTETATLESKLLHNIVGMQKEVLYEIFVDTQKYYDEMDWWEYLAMLEGYGVVPQVCHIMIWYWYWSTIVERASGYYRQPFQVFLGVTQEKPLYPCIFNF